MTILKKIADYASYRRTVRELASLDSAQLKDIGISRLDIRAVARTQSL